MKGSANVRVPMFRVPTAQAREIGFRLLGLVPSRWGALSVEGSVLSRRCSDALTDALVTIARDGRHDGRICLSILRIVSGRGLGPDLSHVVLTWEGTNGVRLAARQCMCGENPNPDYDPR